MTRELLDVVDLQGKKTGIACRACVHEKRLLHQSAFIILLDEQGRVFIQKRSFSKDLYAGQYAVSASGHVDAGESVLHAAKRELREELGLSGVRLVKIATVPAFTRFERTLCTYFKARLPENARFKLDRNELIANESKFLSWKQARKLGRRTAPSLRLAIELYDMGLV